MKIIINGKEATINTFVRLANAVENEVSLATLELVQDAGREEELMEYLNETFSDYKYTLVGVEYYLMFEMCSESTWADLWE